MPKFMFINTFIFLLIDQISKLIVSNNMNINQNINIIPNFFSLNYVHNKGAAFSILNGHVYLFILLGFIAIYIFYRYFIKNQKINKINQFVYGMILSGIIGNMIDRIIYGYVIDFLSFKIFNYDFAIFNLADTFIVLGVIFLIGGELCKK